MKPSVTIFISILFLITSSGHSQSFYKTFDKGIDPNIVTCTEKTGGGFLLVIQTEIPYSDYFFLTNLNAMGQVLWTKRLDFPHADVLPLIMRSNGDSTYTILIHCMPKPTFGDRGAMLLTIDENANILWMNSYGENTGGNRVMPVNFSRTIKGDYVIAGQRQYNSSSYPALIVTDSSGNFQWAKSYDFSTGGIGWFRDVHQTSDGGFIACGDAKPYGFLLKTDSVGTIQWMRKFHNNHVGFTEMYSVAVTNDSCYLAYGLTSGTLASTYLMKVDDNGDSLWVKAYNFSSPVLKSFPIYESGGTFTFLSNVAFGPNSNTSRFNVTKADMNGNLLFSKLYHPAMKNIMSDMQLTNSNGIITSGYVMDTITMDKHGFFMKSLNAISPDCMMEQIVYLTHAHTFNVDTGSVTASFAGDALPVVLISTDSIIDNDLCSPVAIAENSEDLFTITPNPADEFVSVILHEDVRKDVQVSIMTVTGQVVSVCRIHGQQQINIDISGLACGIYFMRVECGDKRVTIRKILVSR